VIGDFTSEKVRGKAMGVLEFSWTLADYIMPLIGVLLKAAPISLVYYIQGGASFIIVIGLYIRYPKKAKSDVGFIPVPLEEGTPLISRGSDGRVIQTRTIMNTLRDRKVVGMCIWAILVTAYMLMFSFVGLWLRD